MTQTATPPVIRRLRELSEEFDQVAVHYSSVRSERSALLYGECKRAAHQLRLVANLVGEGFYTQTQGADWLKAAWRIITAIGREHIK
jgi:hypothetical protein